MVIYDLVCVANHEFEGWFKNSEDLLEQKQKGILLCPVCNSAHVNKKLAVPKVTRKSNSLNSGNSSTSGAISKGISNPKLSAEEYKQFQSALKKMHEHIDSNYVDVGNKFADEALSMHRGEKEAANIKGTATSDQVKELANEGVSALPIPPKPVDKKKLN